MSRSLAKSVRNQLSSSGNVGNLVTARRVNTFMILDWDRGKYLDQLGADPVMFDDPDNEVDYTELVNDDETVSTPKKVA